MSRMTKNKKKKTVVIRWFVARFLGLIHLSISIYFLLTIRFSRRLFFIPIIGIVVIILEIIIVALFKFRFHYSFIFLLTYSTCIISSIWLLELFRINYLVGSNEQQASVEVFSVIYYAPIKPFDAFFLDNKYLWSQIQIQFYIFNIVILKGLCETKGQKFDIIVKTWTTALDMIDFLTLLGSSKLYSDNRFVYITFSVWSFSCLQFIIHMPVIANIFKRKKYYRLGSIMTYSLLSMIITDIPYLIVRLYAIIGVRNHNYTSYFLVGKNIGIIMLQTADVWIIFNENTKTKINGIPI